MAANNTNRLLSRCEIVKMMILINIAQFLLFLFINVSSNIPRKSISSKNGIKTTPEKNKIKNEFNLKSKN
jgi:hypothetical protein